MVGTVAFVGLLRSSAVGEARRAYTLAPESILPSDIRQAPSDVREAYRFAIANREILRYIPCYCGCGRSAGHKDNFDCYVSQPRSEGWSILDTHALN